MTVKTRVIVPVRSFHYIAHAFEDIGSTALVYMCSSDLLALKIWPATGLIMRFLLILRQRELKSLTYLNHRMGKPTICIGENKGTDQLRNNCEADRRLCFRYMDSTIPLLSKSKISSLYPPSVTVQADLCRTWSEPKLLVFLRTGLYVNVSD